MQRESASPGRKGWLALTASEALAFVSIKLETTQRSNFLAPIFVGDLQLRHRVVLAPLTRMRSTQPGDVPNDLNALYYSQRASEGGLLITEATQISMLGKGYPAAPGIHSQEQIEGWQLTTKAVHRKGGFIFLQLWHVGRMSHSSLHPEAGLRLRPRHSLRRTAQRL
jgi:N-ethylmaleimide reductase